MAQQQIDPHPDSLLKPDQNPDEDAAAVAGLDVQVMVVEEGHTQQRCRTHRIGLNIFRLPIPKRGDAIDAKGLLDSRPQDRGRADERW